MHLISFILEVRSRQLYCVWLPSQRGETTDDKREKKLVRAVVKKQTACVRSPSAVRWLWVHVSGPGRPPEKINGAGTVGIGNGSSLRQFSRRSSREGFTTCHGRAQDRAPCRPRGTGHARSSLCRQGRRARRRQPCVPRQGPPGHTLPQRQRTETATRHRVPCPTATGSYV